MQAGLHLRPWHIMCLDTVSPPAWSPHTEESQQPLNTTVQQRARMVSNPGFGKLCSGPREVTTGAAQGKAFHHPCGRRASAKDPQGLLAWVPLSIQDAWHWCQKLQGNGLPVRVHAAGFSAGSKSSTSEPTAGGKPRGSWVKLGGCRGLKALFSSTWKRPSS